MCEVPPNVIFRFSQLVRSESNPTVVASLHIRNDDGNDGLYQKTNLLFDSIVPVSQRVTYFDG